MLLARKIGIRMIISNLCANMQIRLIASAIFEILPYNDMLPVYFIYIP